MAVPTLLSMPMRAVDTKTKLLYFPDYIHSSLFNLMFHWHRKRLTSWTNKMVYYMYLCQNIYIYILMCMGKYIYIYINIHNICIIYIYISNFEFCKNFQTTKSSQVHLESSRQCLRHLLRDILTPQRTV